MPRELVHWHVITEAKNRLPSLGATKLFEACDRFPALPLLGSIAHDAPYYYRMGEDPFEATADFMHGTAGEDTLIPIRRLLEKLDGRSEEQRAAVCAFAFGLLGHLGADTQFHPMIFYLTGNYHDHDRLERVAAQGRHRLIETYLDSWIRGQVTFPRGLSIGPLLDLAGDNLERIAELLEQTLTPELLIENYQLPTSEHPASPFAKRWLEGLRSIAKFQTLFFSPTLGFLMRLLTLSKNPTLISLDALASFGRLKPSPLFDGQIEYLNPITGEKHLDSGKSLLEASIQETLRYIKPLEDALLYPERPYIDPYPGVIGPSLNFGLPGATPEQAHHYSQSGFPLPGLERKVKGH